MFGQSAPSWFCCQLDALIYLKYLNLFYVFDHNQDTHKHQGQIWPNELVWIFNTDLIPKEVSLKWSKNWNFESFLWCVAKAHHFDNINWSLEFLEKKLLQNIDDKLF